MPRPLTEHEREAFLVDLHIAVLSVASDSDRPPLTVPVCYHYQPGGNVTFFTKGSQGRKARKSRLIAKAGALSLCVQQEVPPYKYVTVEGTVVRTDRPPSAEQMLAIVRRYVPEEMAQRVVQEELSPPPAESELVVYTVRPDRWLTFDFSDDAA